MTYEVPTIVVDQPERPRPAESDSPETLDNKYATAKVAEAGVPFGTELIDPPEQQAPVAAPDTLDTQPTTEPAPEQPETEPQDVVPKERAVSDHIPGAARRPPDSKDDIAEPGVTANPAEAEPRRTADEETATPQPHTEPQERVARAAGGLVVEEGAYEDGKVTEPANPSNQEQAVENGSTPQETVNDEISEDATADAPDETPNQEEKAEQDRSGSPHTAQPDNAGNGNNNDKPPEIIRGDEGDEDPELLPYEEYMEQASKFINFTDEGTIQLIDPITGKPIIGDAIPESLQTDSELSKGYEFLARNGYRVDMRLLLSPHSSGTDMTDAGIDLRAEAERLAEKGGVLFLEVTSRNHSEKETYWQTQIALSNLPDEQTAEVRSCLEQMQQVLLAKDGKTSFGFEKTLQLLGTGVEIGLPDYVESSRNPIHQALGGMDSLFTKNMQPSTVSDPVKAHHAYVAVGSAFLRYRDQFLIGSMGHYLSLRLNDSEGSIPIALTAGTAHRNIGSHLNNLGVARVAYVGDDIRNPLTWRVAYTPNMMEGARKGIFTKENLDDITWKW
jgi:hypothetical protein